ncbi:MAG: HAMP domain-containing sensor histidine kinase, partial [Comamonas sp.]
LVSHQFRTPLAVIDSTAQRLMRSARKPGGASTEQLIERMGQTRSTIEGLTRLLDSVLTSVKLENGGIQLQTKPVNVAHLVDYVIDSCRRLTDGRQVAIYLQARAEDFVTAGDAELLIHVLHNLITNACKYTPAGSSLQLTLSRDAERLTCTVRDWGAGVAADELPHLFERFYRGQPNRHATQGTGLGLYLARSIAQLHSGDLLASQPEGGGLAFHLHLPATSSCFEAVVAVQSSAPNMPVSAGASCA